MRRHANSLIWYLHCEQALDHARLTFRWADLQLKMANEVAAKRHAGDGVGDVHLKDVTPGPIDKILALWREAQIRLEIARPGSREAIAAASDIERLREEYSVATELRADEAAALVDRPAAKRPKSERA